VAPVLVLDALGQSFTDDRSHPEIHVGDTHADRDMLPAIKPDLLIPLNAIRADAIVGSVEIVLAGAFARSGGRRGARASSAGDCDHLHAFEKGPAIETGTSSHGSNAKLVI